MTTVLFTSSHLGHCEVRRIKRDTLRVYADENFRNSFNLEIGVQLNDAERIVTNTAKAFHAIIDFVFVCNMICFAVVVH